MLLSACLWTADSLPSSDSVMCKNPNTAPYTLIATHTHTRQCHFVGKNQPPRKYLVSGSPFPLILTVEEVCTATAGIQSATVQRVLGGADKRASKCSYQIINWRLNFCIRIMFFNLLSRILVISTHSVEGHIGHFYSFTILIHTLFLTYEHCL